MHWRILLLISQVALKPLQSYNQHWRYLEHLYFLYRLFVALALIAVPLVLKAQFLWPIELSEAVGNGYFIYEELGL